MAYQYKNPLDLGYTKFALSKKQHNELFPKRKMLWHDRYEYYYNEKMIMLHRFTNWKGILVNTVLFPLSVLLHGVIHFKEIWRELYRQFHQKETGDFISEHVHHQSQTYQDVMKIVRRDFPANKQKAGE
jgi:hypothetical protein